MDVPSQHMYRDSSLGGGQEQEGARSCGSGGSCGDVGYLADSSEQRG